MNKIAPGHIALPQPLPHPPPAATPQARASVNGQLVSLAVPTPGREGLDLHSVLLSLFPHSPFGPPPSVEADPVMAAILALDTEDTAPNISLAPWCMSLLLHLGQTGLMVRLAEKCARSYALNVTSTTDCTTLTAVGPAWPKNAPMTLVVRNTLQPDEATSLGHVLTAHDPLHLQLWAFETADPSKLAFLGNVLRPHHFLSLFFSVSTLAVDTFRALVGITADEITIQAVPSEHLSPAFWTEMAPPAAELVERSASRRLNIAGGGIPTAFIARLLIARTRSEEVYIPFSPELTDLHLGECRIGRLELLMGSAMLQPTEAFMRMLHVMQVRELVVEGMLDLTAFAQALESASANGLSLSLLEGAFLLKDGSNLVETLNALTRDVRIEKALHQATSSLPPAGYTFLGPQDEETLEAQNLINQAKLFLRVYGNPSKKPAAWKNAVMAISDMLLPGEKVAALTAYLSSHQNTFVDIKDLSWMPPGASGSILLADKLKALQACGFPNALIRDAIAYRLRRSPAEIQPMCRAMILARLPTPAHSNEHWMSLGRQHQKSWRETTGDAMFTDRVQPQIAAPTTITTTTVAGSTTDSKNPAITTNTTTNTTTTTATAGTTTPATATATTTAVTRNRTGRSALTQTPKAEAEAIKKRMNEAMSTENSGDKLVAFIADIARRNRHIGPDMERALLALLDKGQVTPELEDPIVLFLICKELLRAGEVQLLRNLATLIPEILLSPSGLYDMARLRSLTRVPYQGGQYSLNVKSNMPAGELAQLFEFARSVPATHLKLRFTGMADTPNHVWAAWADFLQSHPGLFLQLGQHDQTPLPPWRMAEFLQAIPPDTLRGFGLEAFPNVDPTFMAALQACTARSGVQELWLGANVDPQAAGLLLSLKKPWTKLEMMVTDAHNACFSAGTVSAQWLRLLGATNAIDDAFACPGLETIEIHNTQRITVLEVAQLLFEFPSILTIKTPLVFDNEMLFQAALNLLGDRPPVNVEITNQVAPGFAQRLQEALLLRRLRDPATTGEGTGKGWGYALSQPMGEPRGSGKFIDLGAGVGKLLDPQSALALALTSHAAYVGWEHAWSAEMDRIAAWFSPDIGYEDFRKKLLERVNGQSPVNNLAGPLINTHPDQPVLSKAISLHSAGMPLQVIATAIGLQLTAQPSHAQELLEALAFLGVIKAEAWLKDAYAIDVAAPPALQG